MKKYNIVTIFFLLPCAIFIPIQGIDDSPILSQQAQYQPPQKLKLLKKAKTIGEQAHDMLKKAQEREEQENSWPNILKQSLNPFNSINAVLFYIIPALYYKLKKTSGKLSKWWSAYTK